MRLRDLQEGAFTTSNAQLRSSPRTLLFPERFAKEMATQREAYGSQGFDAQWDAFAKDKCWYDPPLTFGIKDGPLVSMPGFRGIQHAHIIKGKCVVVYKVFQDHVRLYTIGDHLRVESDGLARTAQLVNSVDKAGKWNEEAAPSLPSDADQPQAMQEATRQHLINLFIMMTDDADTRDILTRFARQNRGNIDEWLSMLKVDPTSVDRDSVRKLAQDFIMNPSQYSPSWHKPARDRNRLA
jgi:hypothetical protein